MKKSVNCCSVGCDNCSEGTYVGRSLLNDRLYRCSSFGGRKHKEIDARDCNAFRCNANKGLPRCEYCRGK